MVALLAVLVALAWLVPAPAGAAVGPRAVITGGPEGVTPETVAEFTFESTGFAPLSRFECRLDEGPWRTCTSPQRYEALTGGPHSFEVRLTGGVSDPAPDRREWVVDRRDELLPEPPEPPAAGGSDRRPGRAKRRDVKGCAYGANRAGTVRHRRLVRAVRCLINRRRARRDLPRLTGARRLTRAAQRHARDMARHAYFAHASRDGRTAVDRIRETGYLRGARAWTVGEVLAWGSKRRSTPEATVRAWMRSRPHRRVILAPVFRDVGVGLARGLPVSGRPAGGTFVAELGRRSR